MKNVIFLDDSISYFTDSIRLHKVYGRLWDEGIPIAVAITPAMRGDNRINLGDTSYATGIPTDYQAQSQPFPIKKNAKLCRYLGVMVQQRLIELCLHGYYGEKDEFNIDDDVLLTQKIEVGKAELESAIPDLSITTVIAPDTACSLTAIKLIAEYDLHIGTHETTITKKMRTVANNHKKQLFPYGEILFSPKSDSKFALESALSRFETDDLLIIRQPHWVFFDDDMQLRKPVYDIWQQFLDKILELDDITFDTFMYIEQA